jgi:hypothetical protein
VPEGPNRFLKIRASDPGISFFMFYERVRNHNAFIMAGTRVCLTYCACFFCFVITTTTTTTTTTSVLSPSCQSTITVYECGKTNASLALIPIFLSEMERDNRHRRSIYVIYIYSTINETTKLNGNWLHGLGLGGARRGGGGGRNLRPKSSPHCLREEI